MTIKEIEVNNFRNLKADRISINEKTTLFCGKNGQGKTNLLESVWLLSCGKSFRAASDREMICIGKDSSKVILKAEDGLRKFIFEAVLYENRRKEIFINNEKIRKNSDILGNLVTVLFVPDHLNLIKGSPENRRRFIDISLCQQKKSYLVALKEYNRILDERNALLKLIRDGQQSEESLDVWDESLVEREVKIIRERDSYIKKLEPLCSAFQDDISGGAEKFSMSYVTVADFPEKTDGDYLLKMLKDSRETDIITGNTGKGVHKDDIEICINGLSAKKYSSEGQKRSAVISLKLAEGKIIEEEMGIKPVFLFDDVLSELDEARREYIISRIKDFQVIITDCTPSVADTEGFKYLVENGEVRKI